MERVIRRVLVANRGEVAVRVIRACQELGLRTVAVFSDADASALHALTADDAVRVGPAPSADSYLNVPAILDAARRTEADAVHPGYGFLSENAEFARACESAGLVFIGPPPPVIAAMGSKIASRQLMEQAGVPVVPGETPADQSDAGVRRAVQRVGLPALIKASAGGGGRGMRMVHGEGELDEAIRSARREALGAFGDGTLYVERLIERPHHVEVQVFGDRHGNAVHVFERECSVQRRHQKIIEESPSPAIRASLRTRILDAAVTAARAVGYQNAGTIEFLVDIARDAFFFLEMNTRLQVEHPITEWVTGVDLVQAQIRVAAGEPLPWEQDALVQRGHAIEARVYAEDPSRGFLPQAGPLLLYREPKRPGVRVDAALREGDEVSVHYDPLLAKVSAYAETRQAAIARLEAALRSFPILGVVTNVPFLLRVLAHPRFAAGEVDTAFLDREGAVLTDEAPEEPPEEVRLAAAALAANAPLGRGAPTLASNDPWARLSSWRS